MSDETRFSAMFSGSQRAAFNELSRQSANLHTKTISPYEEETLAERKGEQPHKVTGSDLQNINTKHVNNLHVGKSPWDLNNGRS